MQLDDIADIITGYQYRGETSSLKDNKSDGYTIKNKDLNLIKDVNWDEVDKTHIMARSPKYLQEGDILFSYKGTSNFAYCIRNIPPRTITNNQLQVIRLIESPLLPEFVAWQLNQLPCQKYFAQQVRGTVRKHITKSSLESAPLILATLNLQNQVIELNRRTNSEMVIYNNLIDNRKRYLKAVSSDFFKFQESEEGNE